MSEPFVLIVEDEPALADIVSGRQPEPHFRFL